MKILMLGWELPPYNSGGLGVACYYLSKYLSKKELEIDFVIPFNDNYSEIDFMNILSVSNIKQIDLLLGAYQSFYSKKSGEINNLVDLNDRIQVVQKKYTKYVNNLIKRREFDVIHAHDWLTMSAGIEANKRSGIPLIVHVHSTEFDRSGSNYGNPMVHEIEQTALLHADKIFAVSNLTKNIIIERYQIPEDKIDVVHNAIEPQEYSKDDGEENSYKYLETLKSEGFTVVSVITRFTIQKGLINLLKSAARACSIYPKLVFLFAGDGDQRDELIKLSADLGISDKIFFTGFVRGKKWRDAYQISDIFIMSSVSEPFGLTALEAAHYDNALILSKQSGVSEVISNAFKYDFWDIEKLANQIVGIAASSSLRDSLKKNANNEYSKLSWDKVANQVFNLYKELQGSRV